MPSASDVNDRISAVKGASRDYWRDPGAVAEARALWGGGCNEHGTFTAPLEIVAEQKRAKAGVRVAESGNGLFTYGLCFESPLRGFGHFPSIWEEVFDSRKEAMRAAVEELLERIGPDGACQRVRDQLQALLKPRQQGLFTAGLTDGDDGATLPADNHRQGGPMADEPITENTATESTATNQPSRWMVSASLARRGSTAASESPARSPSTGSCWASSTRRSPPCRSGIARWPGSSWISSSCTGTGLRAAR